MMQPQTDLTRLKKEYAQRELRLAGSGIYSAFNIANLFMLQQRQREVLQVLKENNFDKLNQKFILEVGCGKGDVLQEFSSWGAAPPGFAGTDLLPRRVKEAQAKLPRLILTVADGQCLPHPPAYFDLVLQFTVFSSILDDQIKQNLALEILRVLRPGGMVLWYDFWLNPSNPQTRGIKPAEIRRLFPGCGFEFHRITLAPPLARKLVPLSWMLCEFLEKLRIFNTHYLVAIRKPF